MDPAELGYTERRAGSGIWSHPGRPGGYAPGVCTLCQNAFMARRGNGGQRFCSARCSNLGRRKPIAGYRARHDRTERARGKARDQLCVDCAGPAADWSQIHGTSGQDPAHYQPRCRACHLTFDHRNKLTAAQVRGIRASVEASHLELARLHGVHPTEVSRIRSGKRWAHVR